VNQIQVTAKNWAKFAQNFNNFPQTFANAKKDKNKIQNRAS
jgi:hypothetical protein